MNPRLIAVLLLLAITGCKPGYKSGSKPADTTTHPSEAKVQPGGCRVDPRVLAPLVGDADESFQRSLRRATAHGAVIVAYGCEGLRVLEDCHALGSYGFMQTNPRKSMFRSSGWEASANLPIAKALPKGGVDVAWVEDGIVSTTLDRVHGDEIRGTCAGATHFVRAVTTGRFAMREASADGKRTVDEVLGSTAIVRSECADQGVDMDEGWPEGCAPVRLHLEPIAPVRKVQDWAEPTQSPKFVASPCSKGLRWTRTHCVQAESMDTLCDPESHKSCESACEKEDGHACYHLGLARGLGRGMPKDVPGSVAAFRKGCELGHDGSCSKLAVQEGDEDLLIQACDQGSASSCWKLGKREEGERGLSWLRKGCMLGHGKSCGDLADRVMLGEDATKYGTAYVAWRRACEGGVAQRCWAWGIWALGGASEAMLLSSYDAWERGCQRGNRDSCYEAAVLASIGKGGSEKDAIKLLNAACSGTDPSWSGCMALAAKLAKGEGMEASPSRASELYERVCEMKVKAGCREAARIAEELDQTPRASELLGKSCLLGDLDACMRAGELSAKEGSRWYQEGCERFRHGPACERSKRL